MKCETGNDEFCNIQIVIEVPITIHCQLNKDFSCCKSIKPHKTEGNLPETSFALLPYHHYQYCHFQWHSETKSFSVVRLHGVKQILEYFFSFIKLVIKIPFGGIKTKTHEKFILHFVFFCLCTNIFKKKIYKKILG